MLPSPEAPYCVGLMYVWNCELSAAAAEGHRSRLLFCLLLVVLQGTLEIFVDYFYTLVPAANVLL
jgi:hypothetical protein